MSNYIKAIREYKASGANEDKIWGALEDMEEVLEDLEMSKKELYWETMRDLHERFKGEHFNEEYARHEVSKLYHTDHEGKRCVGEKFSMNKAEEVHMNFKSVIPSQYTLFDVYVAINTHFHDYCNLYRNWFKGEDMIVIEHKIIESAITHWFRDEDFVGKGKIWQYFD